MGTEIILLENPKMSRFGQKKTIWSDWLLSCSSPGSYLALASGVPSGKSLKQTNTSACDDLASLRINVTFEKNNLTVKLLLH